MDENQIIKKLTYTEPPNPNFDKHKIKVPFRMSVAASSDTGKSNFVFHLLSLFCTGKGTFGSTTIVCQDADEPVYNQLKRSLPDINIIEGIEHVPALTCENFDKELLHLVIFDDLLVEINQNEMEKYFLRARKFNVSTIYLRQRYYEIPKIIRANCDYSAILRLENSKDTKLVLTDFSGGLEKGQLYKIFEYATAEHFSALFIDKAQPLEKRFRKGIEEIINPNDYLYFLY